MTVQAPQLSTDPARAQRDNERYGDAIRRAGGEPLMVDETSAEEERQGAFESVDGLLLSGGTDLDPALFGEPTRGAVGIRPARDALEMSAWQSARARSLPVLGICRGFQAVNVFAGGRLSQHIEGHDASAGRPREHPLWLTAGSRLARILRPTDPGRTTLRVNSSHHQAVPVDGVAPGLVVAGTSPAPGGTIVEALESAAQDEFVLAVQCHPERRQTMPAEFDRLWTVFVDACRGGAAGGRVG